MGQVSRRPTVILVCEDNQHEAFARYFLKLCGHGPIRVLKSPKGRGSGEQWVHQQYAREVRAIRQAAHIENRALVVVVDEDTRSTQPRAQSLDDALRSEGLPPRGPTESIIQVIPARNIETWLAYLDGETVDETSRYPKYDKNEKACRPLVKALKAMCDARALRSPAPPSLERACDEFGSRMP